MVRRRALIAILIILSSLILLAGCAATVDRGGEGSGGPTATAPPTTVARGQTAPTRPPSGSQPGVTKPVVTLVWPWATVASARHSVKVPPVPVLVHVRVGRHAGYDRIVFQFAGPVPGYRVEPVTALAEDGSGTPVWPGYRNLLRVRLEPSQAHTDSGRATLTAAEHKATPALPALSGYRLIGDFEGVVSYGVRLGLGTPNLRVTELADPSRLVVDIAHQHLARVPITFMDRPNYVAGRQPETATVLRAITPAGVGQGALDAIFAGPTAIERARGLATVRSGASGATLRRISDGVAHVYLRGRPASQGATFTVATLIMPTLKQLPSIDHVKLYGPDGRTEQPSGRSDSIPASLEP